MVEPRYVAVLCRWRLGKPQLEWSIAAFFLALARLGGHQNREGDHRPGWVVLGKGWLAPHHMVDGAESADG